LFQVSTLLVVFLALHAGVTFLWSLQLG
jgi:hypothetical protein